MLSKVDPITLADGQRFRYGVMTLEAESARDATALEDFVTKLWKGEEVVLQFDNVKPAPAPVEPTT